MKKNSPIYSIPITDLTPIESTPPPNSRWCIGCWKWHPNTTVGRYDKTGSWACSQCVMDCYAMGGLIGRSWRETKAHWGFRKS